jgi:hypothetical protein
MWWVHRPGGARRDWTGLLWLPVYGLLAQAPEMLHMQSSLLREAFKFERKSIAIWPIHLSRMHSVRFLTRKSGRWWLEVRMNLCLQIISYFDMRLAILWQPFLLIWSSPVELIRLNRQARRSIIYLLSSNINNIFAFVKRSGCWPDSLVRSTCYMQLVRMTVVLLVAVPLA